MTPLETIARALVAPGKGILAADESTPTIEKRFKSIYLPSTVDTRRAYREMLVTTTGLSEFISGVILFDETIRQTISAGSPIPSVVEAQGIIPGIKVDLGTSALPRFPNEKITQGLDGLRDRLVDYRNLGARFTKWRAVLTIGADRPSATCVAANARALALFATISQEAGLVPIVEPETLMDGDHTLARCEEATQQTLLRVFDALAEHRVELEGMLLKTNMVLPGTDCPKQANDLDIAEATLRCLGRVVPAAIPGIVFLSGGQRDDEATNRLRAICAAGRTPWTLSFSFGRALQESPLRVWRGSAANVQAAQQALLTCARQNSLALRPNAPAPAPAPAPSPLQPAY